MKYVAGVDYGTLSARAIVVERETGRALGECVFAYPHGVMDRMLPNGTPLTGPGWALAHPMDYFEALQKIVPVQSATRGFPPKKWARWPSPPQRARCCP